MKKTVRVVPLACNTPTGPPLYSFEILPKCLQGYQSYGVHKDESTISASGEITT